MYLNQKNRRFKMHSGIKSSIAFVISSILSSGISYITTPIFTRLLTSGEYGQVSVFLTWQSIFAIVAMFSLQYGVFNNGMLEYENDRDCFSYSLLCLSNIITIAFGMVILVLQIISNGMIRIDNKLLILMFAVFLFQPAYNFWLARQRYEYKYKSVLAITSIIAIAGPAVSIISVLIFQNDRYLARILGLELCLLAIYLCFYIRLGVNAKWHINRKYLKYAFFFNLPLLPHYLSTYILSGSDRLMISAIVGDSAVGYYSVAYAIASIGIIVWSAINGSLIPYTYKKCKENNESDINKAVKPILFLIAFCCVMVILVAPEMIELIATNEYRQGALVIPPIVGGIFFQAHYSIYANILYYYKKPKSVMIASTSAAFMNIVLNYIFITKYGYIAAGFTTLFCYILQAALDYIGIRIMLKKDIYDMKFIGMLSFAIVLISIFSPWLYNYAAIRYCIVGVMMLLVILLRKHLMNIFSIITLNKSK